MRRLVEASDAAPLVIGHRGDSSRYPENTLEAFGAAVEAGAHMVEFDVRQTADGVFVCIHDADFSRTTDADASCPEAASVAETHSELVAGLDAGSWFGATHAGTRVPTLEQALTCIHPGSIPMIEHKAGRADDLVALLRRLDLLDQVIVQSFEWDWVREVHALEPVITTGVLGSDPNAAEQVATSAGTGASVVHWHQAELSIQDLERIRALGYWSCVYTADAELYFAGATHHRLGGLTTNRPRPIAALRAKVISGAPTSRP